MHHKVMQVLIVLIGLCAFSAANNWKQNLYIGLSNYVRTGEESIQLRNVLSGLQFPHLFRANIPRKQKGIMEEVVCGFCDVAIDVIISARREGVDGDLIANSLAYLCKSISAESAEICDGVVEINKDTIVYIIDNNQAVTSQRICSMILQDFNCRDNNRIDWEIEIPPPLSPAILKGSQIKLNRNKQKANSYKILQLADMHYDPNYKIGSKSNCAEPLCCQAGSVAKSVEDQAGYWGDYRNCDLPWHSFVDILDHVVRQHRDVEYVYFSGDIINHKVWKTDKEGNIEAIKKAYGKFKESFGNLPVYPILGNHEPHPVNYFSLDVVDDNPLLSTKWLFDIIADEWQKWLPRDTRDTILKGGYYTISPKPGFRIIALNSNVCFTFNFWLFYDDKDPFDQLQWLADTLAQAEKDGEVVHIHSHVPTGDSQCLHNWSNEFVKIIDRFSHIITAQFNGHTHHDDTVLFFNSDNIEQPNNIAFNGGSLTPYADLNPNYKVYEVDSITHNVIDYESWSYNLTEANRDPQIPPQWKKLYSFKEAYGITELTPAEVSILIERMIRFPQLTKDYFRFKNRYADPALAAGCDNDCEIDNLCYMVTYAHGNSVHCDTVTKMYNSIRPPLDP